MLSVDIPLPDTEELQKLVFAGQEKGFLTYDEIAAGTEDVELTKEQLDDFYAYLLEQAIEILEGEQHKHPPHEPAPLQEDKASNLDLGCEQPLHSRRHYLREIRLVALSTADEEVTLAKRIERG